MHPKRINQKKYDSLPLNKMSKHDLIDHIEELESRLVRLELFVGLNPLVKAELEKTGRYNNK